MRDRRKKYVIDTNSLLTPFKTFYSFDFAPNFWNQIFSRISDGTIIIIDTVFLELTNVDDELTSWISEIDSDLIMKRADPQIIENYSEILSYIQNSPLYNGKALKEWSNNKVADGWLVASAIAYDLVVVTFESKNGGLNPNNPSKNPKIPNICSEFGIKCTNLYDMMRALDIKL